MRISEGLKITIITVCKNSGLFLEETINSVIKQTYPNIQYIIIDGNSSDNTVDIIQQYACKIDIWLSEDDAGMYDAINKGLQLATGDYILILNSDDVLVNDGIIKEVADTIRKEKLDYYYGDIIKTKDGRHKKVNLFHVTARQLLMSTHGTFAPHPCFFISARLNKALNGYNTSYKFASDYDYILRALSTKGSKGKHINLYVSKFRVHQNSITASGKIDSEREKILQQFGYYQLPFISRMWHYYTLWIYYKIKNIGEKYKAG